MDKEYQIEKPPKYIQLQYKYLDNHDFKLALAISSSLQPGKSKRKRKIDNSTTVLPIENAFRQIETRAGDQIISSTVEIVHSPSRPHAKQYYWSLACR